MNASDLVASIEKQLRAAEDQTAANKANAKRILDSVKAEGRDELTDHESAEIDRLIDRAEAAVKRRSALEPQLDRAKRVAADDAEYERQAWDKSSWRTTAAGNRMDASNRVERISVIRNERTYRPDTDPAGTGFLADVCRAQVMGDATAWQRLARHMDEERTERPGYQERAAGDLTTTGAGGVVVPQYLVDMTAPAVAARRPLADNMARHPLPAEGMTFVVPTISTATSAGIQATQLTAISATSMAETDLSVSVQTAAGQQNVSRQAVDRSRIDEFVIADLFNRYATSLDAQIINQATVGLSAVAASTLGVFTTGSPTGALLYPKLLAAQSGVEAALLGVPADLCVMHSRRWAWLSKEMGSVWPLINSQGIPTQAGGTSANAPYGSGTRGTLPNGMRVIVDNNILTNTGVGTNQDEVYVLPATECHLWEDPTAPALIRAEAPNAPSLGVLLVVYGYFAYTFQRYPSGAMQKVSGTGLVTPTF